MEAIIGFGFFLLLFLLIGISASRYSKGGVEDYLLASRSLPPWMAGLSAVATSNSSFMFIGLIGYTYSNGVEAAWLIFGWIFGEFLSFRIFVPNIHRDTHAKGFLSFGAYVANGSQAIKKIVGVATLVFLTTYAGGQFLAGSKVLGVLIGLPDYVGVLVGVFIVIVYSFLGGMRATAWTDVAQSLVMYFSMLVLAVLGFISIQTSNSDVKLSQHISEFLNTDLTFFPGILLFIAGFIFGGMGVASQPHVMSRIMAVNESKSALRKVRYSYFGWFLLFATLCVLIGFISRVALVQGSIGDNESAFVVLSMKLFSPPLLGIALAGLFASIISTADSQFLAATSAVTQDISNNQSEKLNKVTLVIIGLMAGLFAIFGPDSVFSIVLGSWAYLAAIISPLIIRATLNLNASHFELIAIMMLSFLTLVSWNFWLNLSGLAYGLLPTFLVGTLLLFLANWKNST